MYELGETIIRNLKYLIVRLNQIEGVRANPFGRYNFQEVLVDFNDSGKCAADINKALLSCRIFGGKDLSREFPQLGQCALYCVSELTTQAEMDKLVNAIAHIVKEGQAWDI